VFNRNTARQHLAQAPAVGRIAQLLRLALGADKSGEIVAAVAALKRTLTASGLDHHALAAVVESGLAAPLPPPTPPPPAPDFDEDGVPDWRSTAHYCRHHRDRLSEREAIFVDGILRSHRDLSEKQANWLWAIEAKLRRHS
jgi:hypothetical protein